jgi:predicted dehydrogenase
LLNLGIIGTSKILDKLIFFNHKNINLTIYGLSGRSSEKVNYYAKLFNCKKFNSHESLLVDQKIDILYINLPDHMHEEWCLKGIENNKHIICEKTFGIDENKIEKILSEANKKKLYVFETFMYYFHHQYRYLEKTIQDRNLGNIVSVFFESSGLYSNKENYRLNKSLGGGILNDMGCYIVNLANNLNKSEIKNISGDFFDLQKSGVETTAFLSLVYKDNFFVHGLVSYDLLPKSLLTINFERGRLTMNNFITSSLSSKIFIQTILQKPKSRIVRKIYSLFKKFHLIKNRNILIKNIKSKNSYELMFDEYSQIIKNKTIDPSVNNAKILIQFRLMNKLRVLKNSQIS